MTKGKGLIEKSPLDHVFMVDDEVLVLWLTENNWEIWADMKKHNNTKTSMLNPKKFTVTGDTGGGLKFGGWNDELYDLVE
jgi:hypothetical protein